ncbi:hypothetical protein RE9416_16960 [Prescottella equi]|nr:hypothetical protein RE9416_16960 [Prescottella equi]
MSQQRESCRGTDSVGIVPNCDPIVRLVGGVLTEQSDESAEARRYLGLEVLDPAARALSPAPGDWNRHHARDSA